MQKKSQFFAFFTAKNLHSVDYFCIFAFDM